MTSAVFDSTKSDFSQERQEMVSVALRRAV